ncbi:MAG: leucine-rich repeat domain-containing protein [Planctomycetes bacterium]|nr:leucine-rich repeat domain-containing protein [Planctomycetota bacterium]
MTSDEIVRRAEEKIEATHCSGGAVLDLSSLKLAELPERLGRLAQLRALDLSGNRLAGLPKGLGQLPQLQWLNLSRNQLTELPEGLSRLPQLQTLNLSGNQLAGLPKGLESLPQLRELNLSGNQLAELPEGLGRLAQLRALDLSGNRLAGLPKGLGQLPQLRELNLSGNQLAELPEWLSKLPQLEKLRLTGNPLNPELKAAHEQGFDAVMRYLRAKAAEPQIVLNEGKLILVGEGEVGKSCLLGALRGDPWVENRPSTHGIELKSVAVTDSTSGRAITLNGWDFGGQRVYRPTHQLFFSAPAVYLVVWKPREGQQAGAVEEWIKLVKHRAPGAKILVIATHGGPQQRLPDIDRQVLWDRFGRETIIGFFHVDSRPAGKGPKAGPGPGIAELRDAIARVAAGLPDVGRTVPASWQKAREALRATGKPYLPLADVLAICVKCGMDDDGARFFVQLEHELGHLIHYGHDADLRDIVILKPDWLATAISFVLDDRQTCDNSGLVTTDRLSHLWSDPDRKPEFRYEPRCHPIFRQLMERFDLSYQIATPAGKKVPETILVAQLVPDVRPEEKLAAAWPAAPFGGQTQQTQLCQIVDKQNRPAAAEGLLYQLIVRLHRYSLGRADYARSVHWQQGVVLEDTYGSRALLEQVENDIRVTVRAPFPDRFLAVLTEEVKALVESFWEELQCNVTVPCLNPLKWEPPCHGTFKVAKLMESSARHRDVQECKVCEVDQDIGQLLRNAPAARPDPLGEMVLTALIEQQDQIRALGAQLAGQQNVLIGRLDQADADADRRGKELGSRVAASFDALMRAMTDEAKDGPRLFSFEPAEPGFWGRPTWISEKFRFTLWCEHARLPLPELNKRLGKTEKADLKRGVYEVKVPRDWFASAAPVLRTIALTLSVVAPMAGPLVRLALDPEAQRAIDKQLEAAVKCTEAFGKGAEKLEPWLSKDDAPDLDRGRLGGGDPRNPIRAAGPVLRQLHAWLKEKDPGFGGLEKVQNKRKEFLWVHPHFAGEY